MHTYSTSGIKLLSRQKGVLGTYSMGRGMRKLRYSSSAPFTMLVSFL